MKRILIIINLLIIGNMLLAQIPFDRNYRLIFEDNFDENISWDSRWESSNHNWIACAREWPSGVTFDDRSRNVCQRSQCQTDGNGHMNIISRYVPGGIDTAIIELPENKCRDSIKHSRDKLRYYTGMLESYRSRTFGYFEIRCKLPTHRGAFPSFWTFGRPQNTTYEEIDFFEYFHNNNEKNDYEYYSPYAAPDSAKKHSVGIWYNPTDKTYSKDNHIDFIDTLYLDRGETPLNEWTVFGCEWRPNYIRWYRNGKLIHATYIPNHIPQNRMYMKINYSILSDAEKFNGWWTNPDTLAIDYVHVYSLKPLDSTSVIINRTQDLFDSNYFNYTPKLDITFEPPLNDTIKLVDSNFVFHAKKQIVLKGPIKIHNNYVMFDVNKDISKRDTNDV